MFSIFKKKTQEQKDAEEESKFSCYVGYLDYIDHPYVGFKVHRERITVKQFETIESTNLKETDCDLRIGRIRLIGYDYDCFNEDINSGAPHAICVSTTGFLFENGFPLSDWKELNIE